MSTALSSSHDAQAHSPAPDVAAQQVAELDGQAVNLASSVSYTTATEAEWAELERQAQAHMRAQLLRYHRQGCFTLAADYDRARRSWELVVMSREDKGTKA